MAKQNKTIQATQICKYKRQKYKRIISNPERKYFIFLKKYYLKIKEIYSSKEYLKSEAFRQAGKIYLKHIY